MSLAVKSGIRQYAGKAAEIRRTERKKQLVDAGITLFGTQGFASVSIDAICAEARLTKRYFYEAFESREALLTEAYTAATQEFMQSILAAAAPNLGDSRKLVHTGLVQTFSYVRSNPVKARLIMIEAMSVKGQLGGIYGRRYDQFVGLLLEFTRPLLTRPAPDDKQFRVLAKSVVGAIIHLCQSWIATDFKQPMAELVAGLEVIFSGLARELGVRDWD